MQTQNVANREQLERRHYEAQALEDAAFHELNTVNREIKRIERDVADRQKWLRAFRGEDEQLRNKLVDSAEFVTFDPAIAEKELHGLWMQLREKRSEMKVKSEKLLEAKEVERKAFYELHRHNHRVAVREALELEVKLFQPLRTEALARAAVAERESANCGSLPVCARVDFGQFDVTNGQSGICHRIREAVRLNYLTGEESWLEGVRWRDDSPQGIRSLN